MATQHTSGTPARTKIVTTNTGRILRVNLDDVSAPGAAAPGAPAPAVVVTDPARRADVLFRKRRDEGHELSSWWMVGAFVVTSGLVILLLSGVPGVA
jgi:hypothetical protein